VAVIEYVKGGIKSDEHLRNALDYCMSPTTVSHEEMALQYVSRDEKCYKTSAMNCTLDDTVSQFRMVRQAFNKDYGIIAHHYVQSFSPSENITPEQAHEIGVEFAERAWNGFQVTVSTHIDKEHIHNHFIVNSCNLVTGNKWLANGTTLSDLRGLSDEICKDRYLSIIENPQGSGVGLSSYVMDNKGVSWKRDVLNVVLKAKQQTSTQEEFVNFCDREGYNVRIGKHITLRSKENTEQAVRLSTLQKQFGKEVGSIDENYFFASWGIEAPESFKRESYIEKRKKKIKAPSPFSQSDIESAFFKLQLASYTSGFNSPTNYSRKPLARRYEPNLENFLLKTARSRNPVILFVSIFLYCAFKIQLKRYKQNRKVYKEHRYLNQYECGDRKACLYKTVRVSKDRTIRTRQLGNVTMGELVRSNVPLASLTISSENIPKLLESPFLYCVKLNLNGTAKIVVAESDVSMLENVLNINAVPVVSANAENKIFYERFKERKESGATLLWFNDVTALQRKMLINNSFTGVILPSREVEGRFNVAVTPDEVDELLRILPSLSATAQKRMRQHDTAKSHKLLADWRNNNVRCVWRNGLSDEEIEKIKLAGIDVVVLADKQNTEAYRICYPLDNERTIISVCPSAVKNGTTSYKELKAYSEQNGETIAYMVVDADAVERIKNSNEVILSSLFKKDDGKYNLTYLRKDLGAVRRAVFGENKHLSR